MKTLNYPKTVTFFIFISLIILVALLTYKLPFSFQDNDSSVFVKNKQLALAETPENLINPYQGAVSDVTFNNANELSTIFKNHHYSLEKVRQTKRLPRLYVTNLPNNLASLTVKNKVDDFIRLLLPNILLVNEQILAVRNTLLHLQKKSKHQWTEKESHWVNSLTAHYGIAPSNIDILLEHIDIIPTSMVLAQGIDESGWGTGYFAIKGNNLYGEHLPPSGGKYLVTPNGKVKVAAFDSIYQATAAYFYNLNSSFAYKDLRNMRAELRHKDKLLGGNLVESLEHYSIRGEAYVRNLQALIQKYQLETFDNLQFDKGYAEIIRFKNA